MIERLTMRRLDLGARLVLAASLCPIMVSISAGQEADINKVGPSFEVATVRSADLDGQGWVGWKLTPSGRFTAGSESLHNLVVLAYGGKSDSGDVVGGPEWANSIPFDINAKVDNAYMADWEKLSNSERFDRVRPMIGALLAERFRLKLRTEIRVTPVYALVQTKGGTKLKEVAPPSTESSEEQQARARGESTKPPPGGFKRTGNTFQGNAMPMQNLKGMIASLSGSDRIVVDETGLKGYYDFTFTLSLDNDGPTIAEQIERQLGLKLEPRKVALTMYVIETAEKPSLDGPGKDLGTIHSSGWARCLLAGSG